MTMTIADPTRRRFVLAGLAATGFGAAAETAFAEGELSATPACDDHPTLREMEGPFYKPKSPERADLIEPGTDAMPVGLVGTVLTRSCRPVSGALVDLWHADDNGDYDQTGFRYRGHVYTGADGSYRFHTIVPALYPGRTRHYHVKVFVPGRPVLTTQLYFPKEPMNARDGLFRRELLLRTAQVQDGLSARFDFVLDLR
jgi:protocatechuate 3,4-dioxygenase beta subunit